MGKFINWLKKFGFNEKQAKRIAAKYPKTKVKMPGVEGVIMRKKDKDQFMLLNSALSYDPNISKYAVRRVGVDGRYYHLLREYQLLDKEIARTAKQIYEGNLIVSAEQLKHWKTNLDKWKRTQKDLNELTNKFKTQKIDPKEAYFNYEKKLKEHRQHPDATDPHQPQTMEELGYEIEYLKREADDLAKSALEAADDAKLLDEAGELNLGKVLAKQQKDYIDLQKDGMRRAIARPFLLEMDKKGIIKLRNDFRNMLDKSTDLQTGGFDKLNYPDVNDMFKYHFGDENWKAIDDIMYEIDNTDIYTKAGKEKLVKRIEENLKKINDSNIGGDIVEGKVVDVVKAKNVYSPAKAGNYMTQEKITKRIEELDEIMNNIAYGDEGWVANASKAEKDHQLKQYAKESEQYQKLLKKENFPSDVTPPLEVSGIDDTLKSDFEVISGDSKKGKEISEKLGITSRPGYPITETGKPDLKLVPKSSPDEIYRAQLKKKLMEAPDFSKTQMTDADMDFMLQDVTVADSGEVALAKAKKRAVEFEAKKKKEAMDQAWKEATEGMPTSGSVDDLKKWLSTKHAGKKRDSLNIRIMKNFNEPLDDVDLAHEGYSIQEIQVLKNARKRLETGEETHPNEALMREKELLADEAGVDVDELTLAIDWGDMTPGNASGGLPRRRYAFGSKGELTDLLQRLKQVQMGEGIYADYSSSNRKAMQRVLTNRINVLLGP